MVKFKKGSSEGSKQFCVFIDFAVSGMKAFICHASEHSYVKLRNAVPAHFVCTRVLNPWAWLLNAASYDWNSEKTTSWSLGFKLIVNFG